MRRGQPSAHLGYIFLPGEVKEHVQIGIQQDLAKMQFSDPSQEDIKDRHHDLPKCPNFLVYGNDFYNLFQELSYFFKVYREG